MFVRSLVLLGLAAACFAQSDAENYEDAVNEILTKFDADKDEKLGFDEAISWFKKEIVADPNNEMDEEARLEMTGLGDDDFRNIINDVMAEADEDKDGLLSRVELRVLVANPVYDDEEVN